ncbi:MAG TPA: cytochrome-c peroxidase, partial [bacterium]
MRRKEWFFFCAFLLIPLLSIAGENPAAPLTNLGVHMLGPQKIGPQPPVPVPPDNPQTSMKIQLGKQLYFDTRLSKDNTISCATCHDPAMGWSDAGPTSKGIAGQMGG